MAPPFDDDEVEGWPWYQTNHAATVLHHTFYNPWSNTVVTDDWIPFFMDTNGIRGSGIWNGYQTWDYNVSLLTEYTTNMLYTNALSLLAGAALGDWTSQMSLGSIELSSDESGITVSKTEYRYFIDTEPNTTYMFTVLGSSGTPTFAQVITGNGRRVYIEDPSFVSEPPYFGQQAQPPGQPNVRVIPAILGTGTPGGPGTASGSVKIEMGLGNTTRVFGEFRG